MAEIMTSLVEEELEKVKNSLVNPKLTREEYLELYAVQQALSWVLNPNIAAAPYGVVMDGKIQPLTWAATDIPAN